MYVKVVSNVTAYWSCSPTGSAKSLESSMGYLEIQLHVTLNPKICLYVAMSSRLPGHFQSAFLHFKAAALLIVIYYIYLTKSQVHSYMTGFSNPPCRQSKGWCRPTFVPSGLHSDLAIGPSCAMQQHRCWPLPVYHTISFPSALLVAISRLSGLNSQPLTASVCAFSLCSSVALTASHKITVPL